MANNLKKFQTEAQYTAATLNYPAVSWVTNTDAVHFDHIAPPNDKIMISWTSHRAGEDIVLWNGAASEDAANIEGITVNGVAVQNPSTNNILHNASEEGVNYLIQYTYTSTTVGECFAGDLGGGFGSGSAGLDVLVPSQMTELGYVPDNTYQLIIESVTPIEEPWAIWSTAMSLTSVFVPDEAVNAYKAAWSGGGAEKVHPISDYSGNLPV